MKTLHKFSIACFALITMLVSFKGIAQTAEKGTLSLTINYFNDNNKVPYLLVKAKTKVDGKFKNVAGIPIKLNLGKDSAGTLIANVLTNERGEATTLIPSTLKNEWNNSVNHTFLATFSGNKKYDATTGDLTVGKAKILVDASNDKKITATFLEMKTNTWEPVKGVDVVIAVKRLGGDLNVNETATFATDSTGKATAEFKRDTIPGDAIGNITLVAKVIDNDQYGNLLIEKQVPWGAKFTAVNDFNKRTLFATGDKAPIWLLLISLSIIIAVWFTLIKLVLNIFKIRQLGKEIE